MSVGGESLGRRIAEQRAKLGWTQQELADRLAVSRVAVSHLESGVSQPGERTIALLAGVFRVEPHELVDGTSYPSAKAERLPTVVARYTEAEMQVALLDNDLRWLADAPPGQAVAVVQHWRTRLAALRNDTHDPRQLELLSEAHHRLRRWT